MKYTIGASSDYNEIAKLRKSLADDFPQSFVVAFKDGKKMDINTAIAESKKK
jgi:N-acetylmuramoyl-L-alanine amidase